MSIVSHKLYIRELTSSQLRDKLEIFSSDLSSIRAVLKEADSEEEIFITPGAFVRLVALEHPGVKLNGSSGNVHVGTMFGIKCRSPFYIRKELRDFEQLADFELEYRLK